MFLLDIRERDKHVALMSTVNLAVLERICNALTAAGFAVVLKHQPKAVEVQLTRKDEDKTQ